MTVNKIVNIILSPCSNKKYGAFYTLVALLVIIPVAIIVGIIEGFSNKRIVKPETFKTSTKRGQNGKSLPTSIVKKQLNLLSNTGVLMYEVKSYSNRNNVLSMYIDFYVEGGNDFINVNDVLLSCTKTGITRYVGKKKDCFNSVLVRDMQLYYLQEELNKKLGKDIILKRVDYVNV